MLPRPDRTGFATRALEYALFGSLVAGASAVALLSLAIGHAA